MATRRAKRSCAGSAPSGRACWWWRSPIRRRPVAWSGSRGPSTGGLSLDAVAGVPQMAIERMRLAPHSALAGKRLAATGLRSQTGALVLSVVRGDDEIATPGPQFRLAAGDVLVVVGQPHQLHAAAQLMGGSTVVSSQPQK